MTDAPTPLPATRYLGDDWSFPYTYLAPNGTPMDITGAAPIATLFARDAIAPVFVMQGAQGLTIVDAAAGQVVFSVAAALTATLRADGNTANYPTRLQIQLRDAGGTLTTHAILPAPTDDARFAPTF